MSNYKLMRNDTFIGWGSHEDCWNELLIMEGDIGLNTAMLLGYTILPYEPIEPLDMSESHMVPDNIIPLSTIRLPSSWHANPCEVINLDDYRKTAKSDY